MRYQKHFRALGTEVFVTLVTSEVYAQKLLENLVSKIDKFEHSFSRFLPDSELTRFNRLAGKRTEISTEFRNLLSASQMWSEHTEGLYSPFILPALQRAGYSGSWSEHGVEKPVNDYSDRRTFGIDSLEIGYDWAKIPKNSALDFGGIGKGYILDELYAELTSENLEGYWLSMGGDIICAGKDIENQPWIIGIQSANGSGENVGKIVQANSESLAIATSGVTKRKGIFEGKAWHHIIDPRTGRPTDTGILTATVSAKTAVAADIYAKCIIIAGEKQARYYRKKGFIDSFFLQLENKQIIKEGV